MGGTALDRIHRRKRLRCQRAWHGQGTAGKPHWFPCFTWPCPIASDRWSGHLGTLQCNALPFGTESVAQKAVSPQTMLGLNWVSQCCIYTKMDVLSQTFTLENLKSGSVWVVMKYQSTENNPSLGSATSLFCILNFM